MRGRGTERRARQDPRRWGLLTTAVVAPLLVLALGLGWLAWQGRRVAEARAWLVASDRTLAQANETMKQLLDQETGLRAYLLTGDPLFLEPFLQAHPGQAIRELQRKVADEPEELRDARALEDVYLAWREAASKYITDPDLGRAAGVMRLRKDQMDRMRRLVAGILATEEGARALRGARVVRYAHAYTLGMGMTLAMLSGVSAILSLRQLRTVWVLLHREREALRARDEFVATLSHELRTPLTAILGWVKILRTQKVTPDKWDRALAAIERSAEAEARLVDDALDVGRVATGKIELSTRPLDVEAVGRAAVEVVSVPAQLKGIALEVAIAPGLPRILGDPGRIRQMLVNLLGNAVKFTPRGGRIDLSIRRAASGVEMRVADDGKGIPADLLPHVFDRYWQADTGLTRAQGGLGLGLAITKELAELHGGRVGATSEGPGKGAAFTITLPVPAMPPPEEPAAAGAPAVGGPALEGVRVLLVDDDRGTVELLEAILAGHGAEVHTAESAGTALEVLQRRRVDVIVSDISMPGKSGYELIEAIRASREDKSRPTPALALSAHAGEEDAQESLRAGFQVHLAKPVLPERLVGAVAQLASHPKVPPP